MFDSLGTEHVQIYSITIIPETQKKQEFRMADLEELDQDEEDNDPIVEINEEANVNSMTVNKIPIEKACSPYKVIQVQTKAGIFPISHHI